MRRSVLSLTSRAKPNSLGTPDRWVCVGCQKRLIASAALAEQPKTITIKERQYDVDEWSNVPSNIIASVGQQLHIQKDHPLSITRSLIERQFTDFKKYNSLFPVVTTAQNFDSLGFPQDHPGRNKTDTYYVNRDIVLRTHTSAHQADTFRAKESDGWLISADVYRRDTVDRSHYPIFHQMEGALTWDRTVHKDQLAKKIWDDVNLLPNHDAEVSDPNPFIHPERNSLQPSHYEQEVEAASAHLKKSLESAFAQLFLQARQTAIAAGSISDTPHEPLKMRWVEAYFPFTSPSWELEVFWQGDWLEVLGCGIIKQELLNNSDCRSRFGWAFGIGIDRIAMLMFNIPDIRLFWSNDNRFLSQFKEGQIIRFVPFSKHPTCYKDVSFWVQGSSPAGGLARTAPAFHENDLMEVVREECGSLVEDVRLIDEFTHPGTGRRSICYRINYRSLERTLTNEETNALHERVRHSLVKRIGVELR